MSKQYMLRYMLRYITIGLRSGTLLTLSNVDCENIEYHDNFTVTFKCSTERDTERLVDVTRLVDIVSVNGEQCVLCEYSYDYDYLKFTIALFIMGKHAQFVINHINSELLECRNELYELREAVALLQKRSK